MREPHWEVRGNVNFKGVASEEEIDWLHAEILREEVHLNQILEYNNSRLIRCGAAKVVGDVDIAIQMNSMTTNWALSPNLNPGPEKIRLCKERVLGTISDTTEFRVGENVMERMLGTEEPDVSTLYVGIANKNTNGIQSTWHKVGSRILHNGETVSLVPIVLGSSGLGLTDEQLSVVGSLIDSFMSEIAMGELPHLYLDGKFDELVVPGLSEPIEA